jgi:hypothetical protein
MNVQEQQYRIGLAARRVAISARREAVCIHNLNGKKSRQSWRQFRFTTAAVDNAKTIIRHANRFAAK